MPKRQTRSPLPRGETWPCHLGLGLLARGCRRLALQRFPHPSPTNSSSGFKGAASHLQWRDRAGFSPDFPVTPFRASESLFSYRPQYLPQAGRPCQAVALVVRDIPADRLGPVGVFLGSCCPWHRRRRRPFYFNPSTSCMSYKPGGLVTTHRAARSAPRANVSRLDARCVTSIRSPGPPKSTV